MFGLLYKTLTYFFKSTPLNKGEVDQPPPLDVQEAHLNRELERVRELKKLADQARGIDYLGRGQDQR